MKRLTRLVLAALAAIGASGALVAAPAASWVNFADTTSEESVTGARQYTLTSNGYTITVNGTPNNDGSVTLGQSSANTNNTGIVLTGLGALSGTKIVSVMLDIGNLPATTTELLAINLNAAEAEVELKRVVANGTSTIQQQWNNSNGTNGGWGNATWTPTNRQILTLTYSGTNNNDASTNGTATYLNGFPLITNKDGLKTTGASNNISRIGIGENSDQSATGMKVYGIYLFTSKLTDAQVDSETAAVITAAGRTAAVSGEANWSNLTWAPSAPTTSSDLAVLQVAEGENTLTLNNGEPISLLGLFTQGTGSLTFDGSGSMTSSFTSISSDTDVSAITANLGAVTLASNKTLTTKSASDFSSITAGAGSTVKYTAPSGSIVKVDNATVELAAAAATSGITLPSAGGTYKVSSGTYTGMTLTLSATATNYTFAGGKLTFNGEFSFGKATATISGGTIRAPKMVTVQGNNDYRTSTVTQTGGDIILSGTTDGSSTQNAVVMFGHWPNARSTYTLSAGSIKAEQGGMRFGNDSPSTLNLSGTGLLKVKGIWGKGSTDCALNLSGGKLSIGSDGFKSIGRLTVTATGGELNAFASNTIAQAIALNGPTTFSADTGFEMTVQGTLSGSGALTIGTETATGTVALGTQRPTLGGIADGATVKLTATEPELANNAITLSTTMTTAPAKERFTVLGPGGTPLTLTAEPTVTDGTLTVTLPKTGGVITATGSWSTAGVSGERVVYVRGSESAEAPTTVTLDADLSGYTHIAVIGHVKFVTTTTQPTLPTAIVLERGSVLTATASFSGNYIIPSGATLVLDGTTTAISSSSALTVNGALKTQGTVTLSGTNAVPAGGTLTVETGTLTLTASDQSLAGTVNIAAGATLVNVTGDALAYDGTPVVNVRGTLDMGSTRWTVGNRNTLNVYAGATIKGVGDQHGALDFYNNGTHTLNVPDEGNASQPVTISAKLRVRQANVLLKFNIALANAKVNLTGIVRDVGSLEKAGSGSSHLVLSGENKVYTGATTVTTGYLDLVGGCTLATSGVTVANNAAVTFQADNASTETTYTTTFALTGGRMDKEGAHSVILSGAITGAGAVNVMNGGLTLDASAATAESPRAVANPITVGLDSGDAGTLTAKGYLTLSNTSNKVEATGTLTIASGTTVLSTTGSGGGIKGNLTIASGATLQCGTGDAPLYNGTQTFDISGTLELTGETRWTISSGATITLREGARLKGAGDSSCAFDFWKGGTITADGDATIEATVGKHNSDGKTLTITQSAGTTTISGEVRNSLGLSVAGSGTVVYAPAAGVTATSSPLVVDTGATLQLLPAAAFTLNGTVTGAGTLVIGDGSAATAVTLATAGNGTDVTVSPKATLTVATGAGEADANKSFTNTDNACRTVTNNGTLKLTSGYGYFKIAGTGKTVVPGSDFLFGIGGANGDGPFSNGLEVPASANFRIRPWNAPQTIVAKGTAAVNGSITKDGGDDVAVTTLQIASDATLSGTGTINVPVAFTEGATLDTVTAAPLLLKGKVTGTIKVKLDTAKAVLTATSDAKIDRNTQLAFADDETSQTFKTGSYRFAETVFGTTHTFTVVPPLDLPESLPEAVSGNEAALDAIYDAVAATGSAIGSNITSVTAVTAQSTGGVAGNVEALALFENLYVWVTPVELGGGTYAGTVTVYYDFGISEMRVKSASLVGAEKARLYVLLCAKVATSGTSTANYATGTIVTLYKGDDTAVNTALTPTNEQLATLGITPAAGEKWFAVPVTSLDTGTNAFKVHASQATATP